MIHRLQRLFIRLQKNVKKPWYPLMLAGLAAVDHFIMVIPTDGLLVTSILAVPRRWISIALWVTLGSVVGATLFAIVIQTFGSPILEWLVPGIHDTTAWRTADHWVDQYGLWALMGIAATPLFQHPMIAAAALANISLFKMVVAILVGRLLKYCIFGWLSSHAPRIVFRLRSIRKEVQEIAPPKALSQTSPRK